MGSFTIDRFANEENCKVKRFNSKFFCKNTEGVNAFTQSWEGENNLLVPPVPEIIPTIRKCERERVQGTLVIPYWHSGAFWPFLFHKGNLKSFIKETKMSVKTNISRE